VSRPAPGTPEVTVFIYSPRYSVDIGAHVFRTDKYAKLYRRLVEEEHVPSSLFLEPEPLAEGDALRVHTYEYLSDLQGGMHTARTMRSELPLSREIVQGFFLSAGGTLLAGREALRSGWAMNLSGGFHHAFPDHAEGFCYLNDVAIAVQTLVGEGLIERVLICDLDLHQGNGTAFIFRDKPEVFTFSMHQEELYPVKEKSDLDIGLAVSVGDRQYLDLLRRHLPEIVESHRPELIYYLAGVDPYEGDQLGYLGLTAQGLRERDRFVIQQARRAGIPLAVVLAGGYALDVRETVELHLNTCRELLDRRQQPSPASGKRP